MAVRKKLYDRRLPAQGVEWRLVYLRSWRSFRNMTVRELAAASGLSVGSISEMENLRVGYSPEGLVKLAKALKTSTSALLTMDPTSSSGAQMWSLWEAATPQQRDTIAEIAASIVKKRLK